MASLQSCNLDAPVRIILKRLSINVSDDTHAHIKICAIKQGQTISEFVLSALNAHMKSCTFVDLKRKQINDS